MVLRETFDSGRIQDMPPDFVVELGLNAFGHAFEQVYLAQRELVIIVSSLPAKVGKYGSDVHGTFGSKKFQ